MNKILPRVTIFLGSLLLFGLQPMVGRTLLPAFGGTAAVWVVCLCAFQVLLLAGYFYAHRLAAVRDDACGSGGRADVRRHLALLGLSAVWTLAVAALRPVLLRRLGFSALPALEVLASVLVLIGLPYVLLSANASLVQVWALRTTAQPEGGAQRGIYRLYAVSNLGSLLGLLVYPFLVEPFVSLNGQWYGFAGALLGYTGLLAWMGGGARHAPPDTRHAGDAIPTKLATKLENQPALPNFSTPELSNFRTPAVLWLVLPAVSTFLLNAVTAHLTQDVMPLPLLWVVLLGVFLLSYVIGFRDGMRRWIPLFAALALVFAGGALWAQGQAYGQVGFAWALGAGLGICFSGCVFLHAWLYRIRPAGELLTRYYLFNALGGAVGGLLASLVAPMVFDGIAEYPIALYAVMGLALVYLFRRGRAAATAPAGQWPVGSSSRQLAVGVGQRPTLLRAWRIALAVVVLAFVGTTAYRSAAYRLDDTSCVYRGRGFFGVIRVFERQAKKGEHTGVIREFLHGTTLHGIEAVFPGSRRAPTAYFTPDAGGIGVVQHPKFKRGEPMRVGLVGMGLGVVCAYCRSNDFYRCYEISPEVASIATNPAIFTFISDAPGAVEVVMGDARKQLEKERLAGEARFDVLIIDPFTGDNIPYHLSTREAYQLYFDRLEPDGILAINISNWHLDLAPLMKAIGDAFGCPVGAIQQTADMGRLRMASSWAFFVPRPDPGFTLPSGVAIIDFRRGAACALPTDEKGSFVGLINWPWKR